MTSHKSSIDKILSFDSLEEFYVFAKSINKRNFDNEIFRGIQSYQSCLNSLSNGDLSSVPAAQKLIDQMGEAGIFSEGTKEVETNIVGFMPCVPNYLSGQPNDMFNLVETDSSSITAPLRIYFETTVHAGTSVQELINRGVAILAFALAMSRIRTVELHALSISAVGRGAFGVAVRLPTTPIDLARVAWVMTSQGYSRNLGFTAVKYLEGLGSGLYKAWGSANNKDREDSIRDTFNLEPHDVVIIRECDDLKMMLTQPIQWVKNMLTKHAGYTNA